MAFSRPSLSALRSRIAADISGQLLDGTPLKPRSVLGVLACVWAGACHLMYGFLAYMFRQFWVLTAESEYLERKAATWGIRRKPGARAAGKVRFAGEGLVPAGAVLRSSSGRTYRLEEDAQVPGTGRVTAVDIGPESNSEAGDTLTLVQAVRGVQSGAEVAELTGGLAAEDDEALRQRLLAALQAPPRGGNAADYVTWAREVPGVTRAWCFPLHLGLGTVGVTFMCDGTVQSAPSQEMVERVQAHIGELAPVTAAVTVFAPEMLPVNVKLIVSPDTEAVREAVKAELFDLFAREGAPGVVLPLSHINEAISITTGESDHVLLMPTDSIRPAAGELPVLGTVTFTDHMGA